MACLAAVEPVPLEVMVENNLQERDITPKDRELAFQGIWPSVSIQLKRSGIEFKRIEKDFTTLPATGFDQMQFSLKRTRASPGRAKVEKKPAALRMVQICSTAQTNRGKCGSAAAGTDQPAVLASDSTS